MNPARDKPSWGWSGFWLGNLILCWFVFRSAIWGGTLLAPLDVAPACFTHYRYVDPSTTGVLRSNAQFDQIVYDLPLQYGIYQAYRRGEVPWWDPYNFSGRPLLADAHINGTDPFRLVAYAFLPFELAYNWTLIGHFVASGVAMFLLLRHWRFAPRICVGLALTYEFAGSSTFFFGFPWLLGSFLYYPLLWLAWDAAVRTGRWIWLGAASLAVAGVFYSGNLQSHSYLVVFAAAFALGYGGRRWADWPGIVLRMGLTGVIGALLAAPVLLNQLEFFAEGVRGVKAAVSGRVYLAGLTSLTSVYPWMLGDFRTLDLRSAFFTPLGFGQNYGLGFHTYIGSAALILAALGAWGAGAGERGRLRLTATFLVLLFLIIISSPLISVFYTRCAGLFVLGAIVLAAAGLEKVESSADRFAWLGRSVILGAVLIALGTNLGALVVYPRLVGKVRQILEQRESAQAPGAIFRMPAAHRAFQITNLPNEVSFRNPETIFAFLSLVGLGVLLLRPALRVRRAAVSLLLMLNLLPAVLFAGRFIPKEPPALWKRLREGGPEQQRAIELVGKEHLRLRESATARNDYLFPDALQHLYQIQTVHGYSALVPVSIQTEGLAGRETQFRLVDYFFQNGQFQPVAGAGSARFQWLASPVRAIQITHSSLNEVELEVGPGAAGELLWTDTRYPGWSATVDGRAALLNPVPPCFSKLEVPAGTVRISLRYQPRWLRCGLTLAAIGGALLVAGVVFVLVPRPRPQELMTASSRGQRLP